MSLAAGTHLGPYEIISAIGAGGMGEVYRARDARLGREIAIKVLPAAFVQDADRLARFEREAKAVAALSHPNILAIFDTGTHDGQTFAVTELLDGETLRERLKAGALPVRRAVDIAVQIARGLSAAHAKGVVHRDLKPENVFLLHDGQVKILDFGLARQRPTGSGATETAAGITDPGVVMGTVGYMAPEQVRGQAVDARTDLFALGAVLYEMLSGQRAFKRDTAAETMTAILKDDPPELGGSRPDLSPALDRIVCHCLEKNPIERFQTSRDVAFALEALSGSATSGRPGGADGLVAARSARRPLLRGFIGLTAIVAMVTVAAFLGRRIRPEAVSSPTFTPRTFEPKGIQNARFMPDGQTVVYDARRPGTTRGIFVRRPGPSEPETLVTTGRLLAVSSTGELAVISHVSGGDFTVGTLGRLNVGAEPRAVLEDVRGADWSSDGSALAVVHVVAGRDHLEYPIGTSLYDTPGALTNIRVSPDGSHIAFMDHRSVKMVDRSGHPTTLAGPFPASGSLAWSPDSSTIVFSANEVDAQVDGLQLHAVTAQPGSPVRRLHDSAGGLNLTDIDHRGAALALRVEGHNGIMVLVPGWTVERDLSWMSSVGPDLSQDGSSLLFTDFRAGTKEANTGVLLRRTDGSRPQLLGPGLGLELSPDGKQALVSLPPRMLLYPTGVGPSVALPSGPIEQYIGGVWFPDGRRVLLCGHEASRPPRCYAQDVSGGPPRAITPEGVVGFELSPDGRRLLAQTADSVWHIISLEGGSLQAAPGLRTNDDAMAWSTDGRSVLAVPTPGSFPAPLERVDLTTGRRVLVKELAPPDRAELARIDVTSVIADGRGYAYAYTRTSMTLYQVNGLNLSGR